MSGPKLAFFGQSNPLDTACVRALSDAGVPVALIDGAFDEATAPDAAGCKVISVTSAIELSSAALATCPSVTGIALRSADLTAADPLVLSGPWQIATMQGPAEPIADFAVTAALLLWRTPWLVIGDSRHPAEVHYPARDISAATLGVIGLGRIGSRVAHLASLIGMQVVAHDPQPPRIDGLQLLGLGALMAAVDIVSIHAPLSPATRHLINAQMLDRCRSGTILINTARAGVLDEAALLTHLESGRIVATLLDVAPWDDEWGASEAETVIGRRLRMHPHAIATPHVAYWTAETLSGLVEGFVADVRRLLR